ncbi:MAG TPA: sensor histidine kinase [Aggregatilineales bacterium]|nr:sensor histidine kinase [Aggregatilineales bacterium]
MLRPGAAQVASSPHKLRNSYAVHARLFLRVSLITLIGIYGWLATTPYVVTMHWTPELASVTIVLLVTHFILYWLGQYIGSRQFVGLLYLMIQGAFLLALSQIAHYPGLVLLEYSLLLGQAISLFESPWLAILITVEIPGLFFLSQEMWFASISSSITVLWDILESSLLLWLLGALPYLLTLALQVRSRREAVELVHELERTQRKLAAYAEQVEALTLVAERGRMARELHDTVAQGVAGLILQMEALEVSLERGNTPEVSQIASQIKMRARDILSSSRRAIDDLRALPGQSGAFLSALKQEVERFSALTGVRTNFIAPRVLLLPLPVAEHILRYVAEGLANVARHAHASQVEVTVKAGENLLVVEVLDNGVGFEPGSLRDKQGHYGLIGIQERARLIGASLEVQSTLGAGTRLRLHLPTPDMEKVVS